MWNAVGASESESQCCAATIKSGKSLNHSSRKGVRKEVRKGRRKRNVDQFWREPMIISDKLCRVQQTWKTLPRFLIGSFRQHNQSHLKWTFFSTLEEWNSKTYENTIIGNKVDQGQGGKKSAWGNEKDIERKLWRRKHLTPDTAEKWIMEQINLWIHARSVELRTGSI